MSQNFFFRFGKQLVSLISTPLCKAKVVCVPTPTSTHLTTYWVWKVHWVISSVQVIWNWCILYLGGTLNLVHLYLMRERPWYIHTWWAGDENRMIFYNITTACSFTREQQTQKRNREAYLVLPSYVQGL